MSSYDSSKQQKLVHKSSPVWIQDEAIYVSSGLNSSEVMRDGLKERTFTVNKDWVFNDFSIDGTGNAVVTGSGNHWHIYVSNGGGGGGGGGSVNITGTSPIQVTGSGDTYNISFSMSGSGIMILNNGALSTLSIPSTPSVLVAGSGGLSWISYGDCSSSA